MKTINVGLLWHSLHSDNLGVGALTLSQVKIINEVAAAAGFNVRYWVWGTKGGKNYADSLGESLEKMTYISLRELVAGKSTIYSEMKQCDVIFDIGEGDSFSDIYGVKRLFLHILTKSMALLAGKPLILSPQTIGPYKWFFSRIVAKIVMRKAAGVFARDDISMKYLQKLGIVKNAHEAIDVAFELPYTPNNIASDKIKVGVNVSGLLFNGGYNQKNMFRLNLDYKAFVLDLLQRLSQRPDVSIYLVPHVPCHEYPIDDDYRVCVELHQQFPNTILAPEFKSPSEAKSYISAMDFFTGARMHACIAAFSSGVPVIPVSYSRKFNGLFSSLQYSYFSDCLVHNQNKAIEMILQGIADRNTLKSAVENGRGRAQEKLSNYKVFLSEVLKSLNK